MERLNIASSVGLIALASLSAAACLDGGTGQQTADEGRDPDATSEEGGASDSSTGSETDTPTDNESTTESTSVPQGTGSMTPGAGNEPGETQENLGGAPGADSETPALGEDPCEEIRCINGGTCTQIGERPPYCECPEPFTGSACEECTEGYEGDDCSECSEGYIREGRTQCRPESCRDVDCGDYGVCVHEDEQALCLCDEGYQGLLCDDCAPGWTWFEGECSQRPPETSAELLSWFDASRPTTIDVDDEGFVTAWRDLANEDPHRIHPTHPSTSQRSQYHAESDGIAYYDDDTGSYSGIMGQTEHFSVYFVMRWNTSGGGQTIWRTFDPQGKFKSSEFRINNSEVIFDWIGPNEFDEPDEVSAQLWDDAGPKKLVVFKRVPFFDGTAHVISNGTDQVISMATNGALPGAQVVQIGYGWRNGMTEYLRGMFHEIIIFDGALESDEEAALVEYLDVKWAL